MTENGSNRQTKPVFDPTINYGHVLTALSFLVAAIGGYYGIRAEMSGMDLRVAKIELTLQQLANVVVLSARQDERIVSIERRLDRLEQASAHR